MYLSDHDGAEQAALALTNHIISRINAFKPTQMKKFVLCLPTGSTPLPVYEELVRRFKLGDVSFEHVITFNLDEYVGLKPCHKQSYAYFMEENLDIPSSQTHLLPSSPIDPHKTHQDSCAAYESLITSLGGIHLLFLGIGENGHVAFNEPASSMSSRTRMVKLDQGTREINARFFGKEQVPTHALTMGIANILEAQEIIVLATGERKSNALKEALEGGINHLCPASVLQMHEKVSIYTDNTAIKGLKESTINYLKSQDPSSSTPRLKDTTDKNKRPFQGRGLLRGTSFSWVSSPSTPIEEDKPLFWSRPPSPSKSLAVDVKVEMIVGQGIHSPLNSPHDDQQQVKIPDKEQKTGIKPQTLLAKDVNSLDQEETQKEADDQGPSV
ncbi:glucosamine-6-phosphate deaminase [Kwoniella shivajii]|uniref:Glucosamine-6-phosphate isomerase n=1 Tax=Kwoniella shivajii TaxID=564305 RepID=A0ABZ1CRZ9_9TREE|nr:glucosamine-6-phosphate deaminase [Kwoniella shivajii]